jgi:hypothetical protein
MDCLWSARNAAEWRLVDGMALPEDLGLGRPRHSPLSRTWRIRDLRTTASQAEAATSITTLAAKPAGIQGFSSPCNIHQSTKNKAAAAAAAAVIKPDTECPRAGPFDPVNEASRRIPDPLNV